MSSLLFVIITTFFTTTCLCQTDVSSFEITTSSDSGSGTDAIVILTLSWNIRQYQCIINETTGIEADSSYGCNIYTTPPFATLITDSLSNNEYIMKIELAGDSADLMRFAGIRVYDEDRNHYDIDSFCLPSQFTNTSAAALNIQSLQCCYWSQRKKYDNFAMGNQRTNAALKISYVEFRSDILNHKNEANEGAVKPAKITKLGITTLATNNAGSLSTFNIKLHWDTDEYIWNDLIPSENETLYTTTFSTDYNTISCEFLSGFNLEISCETNDDDLFGIDSIIVGDESNYYYTIDTFCNSNSESISSSQKYAQTNTKCSNNNNMYAYDGFMYNASHGSVYFMWQNSLFTNVNEKQQALVMNDYIVLGWLHSSTCNDVISPYSKVTIHVDHMNDAENTGWTFSGDHRATVSAFNCPGGPLDPCSRIAGDGYMDFSLDIGEYINIIVQYEMKLSNMPSGTGCYLYYAFDGGGLMVGEFTQSSSTVPVLYHNQSFIVPAHSRNGYSNLKIRFLNTATDDTNYCWFDDFYVFGDYLIQFDGDDTYAASSWTFNTSSWTTSSTHCPYDGECVALTTNNAYAYAMKEYNNIELYNNIVLTLDQTGSQLLVYYSYDHHDHTDEVEILLTSISSSSDVKQIFNVPDADICATTLYIKFMCAANSQCYVDNIRLSGTVLQSMAPTYSPTNNPTDSPTEPSVSPTMHPTMEPITPYPTSDPTTFVPTESPVFTTNSGADKSKANKSSGSKVFVIVFVVLSLIFIGIVIFIWWWYKKRKKMKIPGADFDEPLLNTDLIDLNENNENEKNGGAKNKVGDGGNVKSVIELKKMEKYIVGCPVQAQPGAYEGKGKGETSAGQKDMYEFTDSDSSGSDLAQELQKSIERASDGGTAPQMSDDLKEAEIIGVVSETPQ